MRGPKLTFLLLLIVLQGCGQDGFHEHVSKLYEGTVPLIQAEELRSKDIEEIFLLDTRSDEEFAISHLEGARMIDYEGFRKSDVKDIPKDAELIVYCSVGYRSERIGEQLQAMGFTNVKNLYGGIFDWKNKGLDVVDEKGQPTDSVHTYNFVWSQWLFNGIKVY